MFWLGGTENSIIDFIMSQNYPGHYENDYDQVKPNSFQNITLYTKWFQEWLLEVPNGYVHLSFLHFDVGAVDSTCRYDHVEVSYGSYSEKFCGNFIPGPFTSTGPTMTVRIHTNWLTTYTGFRAVWGDNSSIAVGTNLIWIGDNSTVDSGNWATGFPVIG